MRLKLLSIIIAIIVSTTQMQLDAVIVNATGFSGDPAICVITDFIKQYFYPGEDMAAIHEQQSKNVVHNLIEQLAKGPHQVDVIVDTNPTLANVICANIDESKNQDLNHGGQPGLFFSLSLLAQKNIEIGNVHFIYSDTLCGPAICTLRTFFATINNLAVAYIRKHRTNGSMPEKLVELWKQKNRNSDLRPSDWVTILGKNVLKKLFVKKLPNYNYHSESLKQLKRDATVEKLFEELRVIQQSIGTLKEQLAALNFPQMQLIEGFEQKINKLIDDERIFFEKYTGRPFDKIMSLSCTDIILNALKNNKIEEVIVALQDWVYLFHLYAHSMIAFQTILQSISHQRKVLFIGDQTSSRVVLALTYYLKHQTPPEELETPFIIKFNLDKVNKQLLRIKKALLDLPTHSCRTCGSCQLNLQKCSRCKKVRYCSGQCQRIDWPQHKLVCKE